MEAKCSSLKLLVDSCHFYPSPRPHITNAHILLHKTLQKNNNQGMIIHTTVPKLSSCSALLMHTMHSWAPITQSTEHILMLYILVISHQDRSFAIFYRHAQVMGWKKHTWIVASQSCSKWHMYRALQFSNNKQNNGTFLIYQFYFKNLKVQGEFQMKFWKPSFISLCFTLYLCCANQTTGNHPSSLSFVLII